MVQTQSAAASAALSPSVQPLATPPASGGDLFSLPPSAFQPKQAAPNAPIPTGQDRARRLIVVAEDLLTVLCRGEALGAPVLRRAVTEVFGGSDAEGVWSWKDIYEVQELGAPVLRRAVTEVFGGSDAEGVWSWKDIYEVQELAALMFVRKYREALNRRSPEAALATLEKLQSLLATHTRHSDASQR